MTTTQQVTSPEPSRDEIAEAITNMAHTAARMPAHWVDKRAALHDQINALLDQLERTPA